MKILFNHVFGKITKMDIQYTPVYATVEPHEVEHALGTGWVKLYWDDNFRFSTTGAGTTSVGISTVQEFSSMGMLKERVKIVANKLSAGTNIDLSNGMIHYYSTNETTTATPDIRWNSTYSLNSKLIRVVKEPYT